MHAPTEEKTTNVQRPTLERNRSSGVGGAGNIRRSPSEDPARGAERPVMERARCSGVGGAGNVRRPSKVGLEVPDTSSEGKHFLAIDYGETKADIQFQGAEAVEAACGLHILAAVRGGLPSWTSSSGATRRMR